MPYKGGVQLLPETERRPTLKSYTSGNGYFWTGIALGVAVIIIGAILGGYAANLNDQIAALDGKLDQSERSRDTAVEQTLLDAQRQAKLMRSLLISKVYWSQALDQMDRMMQSSVTLTRLEGSAVKGAIDFSASAPDYASVAKQLAAFAAGNGVSDLVVNAVTADPNGLIDFDGTLTIDTATLLNKKISASSEPSPTSSPTPTP